MSMAPGWYPDPYSPEGYLRWWDGQRWTAHSVTPTELAERARQAAAPAPAPYGAPPAQSPPSQYPPRHGAYGVPAAPYALAGWGRRFGAFVLDQLLLAVITVPLIVVVLWPILVDFFDALPTDGSLPPESVIIDFQQRIIGKSLVLNLVTAVVSAAYYIPQYASFGRTLGHRVAGIRVRSRHEDRRPTGGEAVRRWLAFLGITTFVSVLWLLLDGLWPLWDKPYAQALHDKFAGTVVVPASAPLPGPVPPGPGT